MEQKKLASPKTAWASSLHGHSVVQRESSPASFQMEKKHHNPSLHNHVIIRRERERDVGTLWWSSLFCSIEICLGCFLSRRLCREKKRLFAMEQLAPSQTAMVPSFWMIAWGAWRPLGTCLPSLVDNLSLPSVTATTLSSDSFPGPDECAGLDLNC